ncbi:hypothetical protein ACWED2_28425 [Amycolatopsis sp. NPDC005003]
MKRSFAAIGAGIGIGVLIEIGYAAGGDRAIQALAVLLMVSAAAFVSGGFLGFLFGVPKILATRTADDSRSGARTSGYAANTNLEQISDWLTKILLGAGLTQIGSLGREFGALVGVIAPAVRPGGTAVAFVGAMLISFGVGGFIAGWLTTRLLLVAALTRADQDALDRFVEAQYAELSGDPGQAEALRKEAIGYLGKDVETVARRYDESRQLPAGPLRTSEMENITNLARQAATGQQWSADQARQLFTQESPGARIFALGLMQGNTDLADFGTAVAAVGQSKSAFEQYQGLLLARSMLDGLDESQRKTLREVVSAQLAPGGWIRNEGARWTVARSILARLPAPD